MPTTEPTFGWTIPEDADALADGAAAMRTLAAGIASTMNAHGETVVVDCPGSDGNWQGLCEPVSEGSRYRYNRTTVEIAFRFRVAGGHSKNQTVIVYDFPAALAPKGGVAAVHVQGQGGGAVLAVQMHANVAGTTDATPGRFALTVLNASGAWDSSVWIRAGATWLRDTTSPLP